MDARIQYATTSDGYSLAYWRLGEGITAVIPPPAMPWSDIQDELRIPEWMHWYQHLGEHMSVVRYDGRGSGSSERDVTAIDAETHVRDLEAVIDSLGAEKVALFGVYYSAHPAIMYAARHPERVSHLITWCGFANGASLNNGQSEAFRTLIDADWQMFTETIAHAAFGWGEGGGVAHRVAEYLRGAATKEVVQMGWIQQEEHDVRDYLPKIQCPTLVLHRRQFPLVDVQAARELAAAIPGAQLTILDGGSLAPYIGDMEAAMDVMFRFLDVYDNDHAPEAHHARAAATAGFRTIMFTDMAGSTEATQRLGDERAQEIVRRHNRAVRSALHMHHGEEIKHTGDGIMAAFTSATQAVECAAEIQRRLRHEQELQVRIGLNAGEPVAEAGDLFGTSVQLASRVATLAEAQQILVTDVIRQLVAGKGFLFSDRGETVLRGFEDPVRVYELQWRDSGGIGDDA